MEYRLYKENDFRVSSWTGGKTTQLAIFPEDSSYLQRNFLWRLSTATCEKEEADFSKLPDYDRVLMVLSGNVVLAHKDVRVARLSELEQDRFDGACSTRSFGQITDYNLMVAKGNEGFLDAIALQTESRRLSFEEYPDFEKKSFAFFCRDGYGTVSVAGDTVMMMPGQQLVITAENGEDVDVSVMGEGTLIRAQIFYNYHPEEMGPTVIPKEKASFDDFRTCVYLANVQFRGARFIFPQLKKQWFDEELSRAIRKLERIYLPFFVTVAGLCAVAGWGAGHFSSAAEWIAAVAAWLVADILLVSPLMYFAVVPKPTRAHIRDVDRLTPYEQRVREKELATNERLERVLKKYKTTGRAVYDEEGNRLDKTFK
ncbi:MAG: HutD family protein [Emergencia sp.]